MLTDFDLWKRDLVQSAGSGSPSVLALGDYVLQLFYREGCEPNLEGMLEYAQAGLCHTYDIRASAHTSPAAPSESPTHS